MNDPIRREPGVAAAAERLMQAWARSEHAHDEEARGVLRRFDAHRHSDVGRYLAISREAGAGGGAVAQEVGQRLGWQVLDRGLVDRVAADARVDRDMLDLVDETEGNWVFDVLGVWMDAEVVPHERYVAHLTRLAQKIAKLGQVVFVGRGLNFVLPKSAGISARIVAPLEYRIERFADKHRVSAAQARREIERIDRGRKEFVERYFHHSIDDPGAYDLVLNVQRLGPERTVELIYEAVAAKVASMANA